MYRVLCEMKLATLPGRAAEDGAPGGSKTGVIVGGDEQDATQTTPDHAVEKRPPMNLRFRKGSGDPKEAPAALWSEPDRGENGGIADGAIDPDFFVSGIEDEIPDFAKVNRPGFFGSSNS